MSKIIDVSGKLGEYMLKGWVLTDNTCPSAGCSVPLMRSPNGVTPATQFCANCDRDPTFVQKPSPGHKPHSSPSISSSSHVSRSSTPATEVSSTLSSPTFAPPVDTEESLRRRQQSDTASAEIGKRLLKGWAMLGEECPNSRCYGVPLVRPPKAGGTKDPRKECVICGTIYVDECDVEGFERLVPIASGEASTTKRDNKGKAVARDQTPQASRFALPEAALSETTRNGAHPTSTPLRMVPVDTMNMVRPPQTPTASALQVSARSLELSLHTLSEKLTFMSSGQTVVDPSSIALTADAIARVTQALHHVRQLQWSETQVDIIK